MNWAREIDCLTRENNSNQIEVEVVVDGAVEGEGMGKTSCKSTAKTAASENFKNSATFRMKRQLPQHQVAENGKVFRARHGVMR